MTNTAQAYYHGDEELKRSKTRFCSHHSAHAKEEGGLWLISNHGKVRRWICAACKEKRILRKAQKSI